MAAQCRIHFQAALLDQRNSAEKKEERKIWVETKGASLTAENSVFIDESPFSICTTRRRGRSRKGEKATIQTSGMTGKNHTLICAISPTHGVLHWQIHVTEPEEEFVSKGPGSEKKKTGPRGVTQDIFCGFLLSLLDLPLFHAQQKRKIVPLKLVFDNARIHGDKAKEIIFGSGHEMVKLSPYSPALNPIEYAFSKMKFAFHSQPHDSDEEVDAAIQTALKAITPADCLHYFQHTQSLYPKCSALEDL